MIDIPGCSERTNFKSNGVIVYDNGVIVYDNGVIVYDNGVIVYDNGVIVYDNRVLEVLFGGHYFHNTKR
jgi:hypothetical protein